MLQVPLQSAIRTEWRWGVQRPRSVFGSQREHVHRDSATTGAGGGIYEETRALFLRSRSTFTRNTAPDYDGGGIFVASVVGMSPCSTARWPATRRCLAEAFGAIAPHANEQHCGEQHAWRRFRCRIYGSNDLIGDGVNIGGLTHSVSGNPLLSPLGYYGGPTQTFALLPGSRLGNG